MSAPPPAAAVQYHHNRQLLETTNLAIQSDIGHNDRISCNAIFGSITRLSISEDLSIIVAALLGKLLTVPDTCEM